MGLGEGASGLPQPPDTVPWFMSNCQPQSSCPPGQSRLPWASGEVACPATMFTVLRRHWEPDLGRPGWAAPLGPSCVHTHFPETEHGRPPASLSPAAQPPAHGGPSFPSQAPWTAADCARAQGASTGPEGACAKGERKGPASSRQVHVVHPAYPMTCYWAGSSTHSVIWIRVSNCSPQAKSSQPLPVSEDCLLHVQMVGGQKKTILRHMKLYEIHMCAHKVLLAWPRSFTYLLLPYRGEVN